MPAGALAAARPIQACQRCRKYKVGCDRARPCCRRCAKSRSECIYLASDIDVASINAAPVPGHLPGLTIDASARPRASNLSPPDTEASLRAASSRSASPDDNEPNYLSPSGKYPCSSPNFRSADLIPAKTHVREPAKRDRAILSCIRCRKHKVRCDRRTPCGRCMKNNKESECVYAEPPASDSPGNAEKPYKSLHGIATTFIDHRWDNRFRNMTHWTGLLREVCSKSYKADKNSIKRRRLQFAPDTPAPS